MGLKVILPNFPRLARCRTKGMQTYIGEDLTLPGCINQTMPQRHCLQQAINTLQHNSVNTKTEQEEEGEGRRESNCSWCN